MTTSTDSIVRRLPQALVDAERMRTVIPLPDELAAGDGYRIQLATLALRERAGDPIVGFKVGMTTVEAQANFGLDHPGYGRLYRSMMHDGAATIDADILPQPISIESEVAVVLRTDLTTSQLTDLLSTPGESAAAIGSVRVAAEIVTRRWERAADSLEQWAADNGSAFGAVLGSARPVAGIEAAFTGSIAVGDRVYRGQSAGIDRTLAWLGGELADGPTPLFPGAVILTGSVVGPVPLLPGERAVLTVDGLGEVDVEAR